MRGRPARRPRGLRALERLDAGDVVECEIIQLGCLSGTVVAIDAPRASTLGVGHAPIDSPEVRRVALGFDERVPQWLQDNLRRAKSRGST